MTTLEKIDISKSIASTKQIETSMAGRGRQEVAAQGKSVPVSKPLGASQDEKKRELSQAVEQISGYVQNITRELNFSIDEELDRPVVTVLDQDSGEVIRQIPTEEVLSLARNMAEIDERSAKSGMKGILFRGDA